VKADLSSTLKLLLRAGSDLALVYTHSLKNITLNRIYSADVMGKIGQLLEALLSRLNVAEQLEG
jgi:hypothetical protein